MEKQTNTNQNNGLLTNVWGPPAWVFLHSVTFGYPENPDEFDRINGNRIGSTKERYRLFFENLMYTLPCKYCRQSYSQYYASNPIRLESRAELTRWLYDIHNLVNTKLEKPYKDKITFEDVQDRYESYRAACNDDEKAKGCTSPLSVKQKTLVYVFSEKSVTAIIVGLFFILFLIFYIRFSK